MANSQPGELTGSQPAQAAPKPPLCIKLDANGTIIDIRASVNGSCPQGYSTSIEPASNSVPQTGIPNPLNNAANAVGSTGGNIIGAAEAPFKAASRVSDALLSIYNDIRNPDWWKGVGLMMVAIGVGMVGVFVWAFRNAPKEPLAVPVGGTKSGKASKVEEVAPEAEEVAEVA